MKRTITSIIILCCFAVSYAGEPVYLMDNFTLSIAKMKVGLPLRELFNYNCETQKVEFVDEKGYICELSDAQYVDTLFLGSHRLTPYRGHFIDMHYSCSSFVFFVDYKCKKDNKGKIGAYGIRTHNDVQTVSRKDYDRVGHGGMVAPRSGQGYVELDAVQDEMNIYEQHFDNSYVVDINGKRKSFKDRKSLLKVFPDKTEAIENYLSTYKLNFSHTNEVLELMTFLFT